MDGAVRLIDSSPLQDAASPKTESVPTSVSPVVIGRVGGLVVAQRGRVGTSRALVAHRGAKREARSGHRSALADRGLSTTRSGAGAAPTVTVTAASSCWSCRLIGYRVHAGPVVVRAGRGRGGQADRLVSAPRRSEPEDRVRAHLRVSRGDRRVGGLVVAQRGRVGTSRALVAHRGAQCEARSCHRSALADRGRVHHKIGSGSRANRYGHRRRAVVGRVELIGYRVHAGPVVVSAGRGRRVRLIDSSPLQDAASPKTESVPTSVSPYRDRRVGTGSSAGWSSPNEPRPGCAPWR